jgi:hypothetical protein
LNTTKGKVLRNIQIDLGASSVAGMNDTSYYMKKASREGSELMRKDKKELEENLLLMQ